MLANYNQMAWHSLKTRAFWDRIEYVCVALGGGFYAITATQSQDYKRVPAVCAFGFTAAIAFAKWQSKKNEEKEKVKRSESDLLEREQHKEALNRITEQAQSEIQSLDRQLEEWRERHDTVIRKTMKAILNDFHEKYFRREGRTERYKHRATLFVCEEGETPWGRGKRLAVFARSGDTLGSSTTWPVDDTELERCRGLAAQIWFHGAPMTQTASCDWPSDGDTTKKTEYADSMGITVQEAESIRIKSRVLTGDCVKARGKKWGVLLLDSQKEGYIKEGTYEKKLIDNCLTLITLTLNEVGI